MADPGPSPFRYHLELTPAQLKAVHDALRALAEGADDRTRAIADEVLAMLPDEEHIAQIRPGDDGGTEHDDGPAPPDLLA
ncbi:MAG: hypothetical protein U0R51_07895 [Solirubrobacterales bacterium]